MKDKILCLFKEPFKDPVRVEVENGFRAIQKQVNCDTFQCLAGPVRNTMAFIDDEAKFKPNALPNMRYGPDDIIVGNILFAGIDSKDGENNVDLTEKQIDMLIKCIKNGAITSEQAKKINVKDYTGFTFIALEDR